jgi:hypothetical protein
MMNKNPQRRINKFLDDAHLGSRILLEAQILEMFFSFCFLLLLSFAHATEQETVEVLWAPYDHHCTICNDEPYLCLSSFEDTRVFNNPRPGNLPTSVAITPWGGACQELSQVALFVNNIQVGNVTDPTPMCACGGPCDNFAEVAGSGTFDMKDTNNELKITWAYGVPCLVGIRITITYDEQTTAEQTTAEETTAEQTTAEQTTAEETTAEQTTAEQTTAEQTTAEQTTAEQTTAEQTTAEQTTAGSYPSDASSLFFYSWCVVVPAILGMA